MRTSHRGLHKSYEENKTVPLFPLTVYNETLCVDRTTQMAVSCVASTVPTMCPSRLKYLNLLREIESFVCSGTEMQGLQRTSRVFSVNSRTGVNT